MFGQWNKRTKVNRWAVDRLHQSILNQALRPELYGAFGGKDTFSGRFEMTAVHAALVFRRLRDLGPAGQALAQESFDALFDGFDDALREIGTGDLSVGRKIRKMGEAFYGRAKAYDSALAPDAPPGEFAAAIARNFVVQEETAERLARYLRSAEDALMRHTEVQLLSGEANWPKPPVHQATS